MRLTLILLLPILPAVWLERWRQRRGIAEFSGGAMVLALIPGRVGSFWRREFYRRTLARFGENVEFKFGSFCQYYCCELGSNVFVGVFNALGEVSIGNDVIIGGFVNIVSGLRQHGHRRGVPFWRQPARGRTKITIGDNVWIGSNCCIAANIGTSAIVGLGSVVVREVEAYSIVAGNPAQRISDVE